MRLFQIGTAVFALTIQSLFMMQMKLKSILTLFFILLLVSGCSPYRIRKIPGKWAYMTGGENSGYYKTTCEEVFTQSQTNGFIGVTKEESLDIKLLKLKAQLNWKKDFVNYLGEELFTHCLYHKKLRRSIYKGTLKDSVFIALADTMIHKYPASISQACNEILDDTETGKRSLKFYTYYVVEYPYSQFVSDLKELSYQESSLPKGLSQETALVIADFVKEKSATIGAYYYIHKVDRRLHKYHYW